MTVKEGFAWQWIFVVVVVIVLAFFAGRVTGNTTDVHPTYHGGTAKQWADHSATWKAIAIRRGHVTDHVLALNRKILDRYRHCVDGAPGC